MSEPTRPAGWCHWHKGESDTAVAVQIIERMSAASPSLDACASCRAQHGLTPLASAHGEASR